MKRSPAERARTDAPGATPRCNPPLAAPVPAATEATEVPCPRTRSVSGTPSTATGLTKPGPVLRAEFTRTFSTTLLWKGRSGWVASTPVSSTAMVTPAPEGTAPPPRASSGSASTSPRPIAPRLSTSKKPSVLSANTERTWGRAAMARIWLGVALTTTMGSRLKTVPPGIPMAFKFAKSCRVGAER